LRHALLIGPEDFFKVNDSALAGVMPGDKGIEEIVNIMFCGVGIVNKNLSSLSIIPFIRWLTRVSKRLIERLSFMNINEISFITPETGNRYNKKIIVNTYRYNLNLKWQLKRCKRKSPDKLK
jgi:hypothetical protein